MPLTPQSEVALWRSEERRESHKCWYFYDLMNIIEGLGMTLVNYQPSFSPHCLPPGLAWRDRLSDDVARKSQQFRSQFRLEVAIAITSERRKRKRWDFYELSDDTRPHLSTTAFACSESFRVRRFAALFMTEHFFLWRKPTATLPTNAEL